VPVGKILLIAIQSEPPGVLNGDVGVTGSSIDPDDCGGRCCCCWDFLGLLGLWSCCCFFDGPNHFHFELLPRDEESSVSASEVWDSEANRSLPYLNFREWPRIVSIERLEQSSIVSGKHDTETRSVSSTSVGTGKRDAACSLSVWGCCGKPISILELSHSSTCTKCAAIIGVDTSSFRGGNVTSTSRRSSKLLGLSPFPKGGS